MGAGRLVHIQPVGWLAALLLRGGAGPGWAEPVPGRLLFSKRAHQSAHRLQQFLMVGWAHAVAAAPLPPSCASPHGPCRICRPPGEGGESVEDVAARTAGLVQQLEQRHSGKHLVLVSHGDALSILAAALLGTPLGEHRRHGLPNCGILRIGGSS